MTTTRDVICIETKHRVLKSVLYWLGVGIFGSGAGKKGSRSWKKNNSVLPPWPAQKKLGC